MMFREDYLAGFPWHPHRGIETITYVLAGTVEHGDSMGNRGAIAAGDVQWMTAGSGIIHQEMPKGDRRGRMHGFQLWANLPASLKMTAPRYQEVKAADIPEVTDDDGTERAHRLRELLGEDGPGGRHRRRPDLSRCVGASGRAKTLPVETTRHAFAYVFAGAGKFCNASGPLAVPTEGVGWAGHAPARRRRTTARWSSSTAATKSRCRPARTGSGSCWFRASRWKSRWRGTARS